MLREIKLNNDDLKKLYTEENKTSYEIADIYNCNRATIIRRLRKIGVSIKKYKRKYSDFYNQKLTEEQKEILYGSILGDGCIEFHHNGTNGCRYIETHSEKQLCYLRWKMNKLDNFISIKTPYRIDNSTNNSFSNGVSYRFYTVLHSEFSSLRDKFYRSGKKFVPLIKLTPLSFAMWYYDDGNIDKRGNRISIWTLDLDNNSISNLLKTLKDDLGLQAKTFERKWVRNGVNKKGKIISFDKKNVEKILKILNGFRIKSMEYKLLL